MRGALLSRMCDRVARRAVLNPGTARCLPLSGAGATDGRRASLSRRRNSGLVIVTRLSCPGGVWPRLAGSASAEGGTLAASPSGEGGEWLPIRRGSSVAGAGRLAMGARSEGRRGLFESSCMV